MHHDASGSIEYRPVDPGPVRDRVGALAGQVIAMLRGRDGRMMHQDEGRLASLADRLIAAALAPESDALPSMLAAFRREGVDADAVCDLVMPLAARELGRGWEDDRLSFVDVSLGMVRMQRLLRDRLTDIAQPTQGPSVLFILPEGEQHTLGALVAVRHLRRRGLPTTLLVGEKLRAIAEIVRTRRFDAAFVSIATAERLETAREVVACINTETAGTLPVVVGGALLCGMDQVTADGVRASSGARLASNDLGKVLAALGLAPETMQRTETA